MPTHIRQPSARALAPSTADINSNSITPLTIIAVLIFVLHLAAGATLGRSPAGASIGQGASTALAAEIGCAAEPRQNVRTLPYD